MNESIVTHNSYYTSHFKDKDSDITANYNSKTKSLCGEIAVVVKQLAL